VGNDHATREIAIKNKNPKADTEDIRQAMIYCHSLFKELLRTGAVIPERKKK
jgi:hypothetical protein